MKEKVYSRKKVLIVNSHIPWGGLGQFTLSLARGLVLKDYEVYGLVTHDNKDNYDVFKSITNRTKYVGNINKYLRYLSVLSYIWKLKPDVIIVNYNAVIHFLLPFIPKTTVISILHSDDKEFYRISMINHKYVDAWVAPTAGVKNGFVKYVNLDRTQKDTVVISHGIASSDNVRQENPSLPFTLAFVGAVYKHKGADLLPAILEKVLEAIPDVKLLIIGEGELTDELNNEFSRRNISNNVSFMGVIPHEKVRKMLFQSDVLLFPTRVEAFGLVIAEAMMEGAVPVVTLLPGITDATVEDGKTGYLIQKDDVDGFAEKIIRLGEDRELLIQMSKASKAVAEDRLSLEKMSQNYDALIKNIHESNTNG
jgi:glycosyltransferase involved in cell wall biosynthesis